MVSGPLAAPLRPHTHIVFLLPTYKFNVTRFLVLSRMTSKAGAFKHETEDRCHCIERNTILVCIMQRFENAVAKVGCTAMFAARCMTIGTNSCVQFIARPLFTSNQY